MLISLVEYAARHDRTACAARRMAMRGSFKTARKIGRNWVIEDTEPWPDRRVKSGKYIKKKEDDVLESPDPGTVSKEKPPI